MQCVQCGNYINGRTCTELELIADDISPCGDPTTNFCMTDVIVDSNSQVSVYKRLDTLYNWWFF